MKTGHKAKRWSRAQLARLACDTAGNTMLMMAAAMIPIIGMAGSAFDMSRAYMVKSRLQQACDAGALAGRRAMTLADFDDDTAAKQQANRFFNFNYPAGSFSTTNVNFTPTGTNDGQVTATARATVPMAIMKMFGVTSMAMTVNCDARLEIANNDIMFALDVTGSMSESVGGTQKIVALRDAVNAFYDVLDDNTSASARIRYGFVPFSSGINVGQLLLDNNMSSYLVDSHAYAGRVANYATPEYHETSTPLGSSEPGLLITPGVERFQTGGVSRQISNNNCGKFGSNTGFTQNGNTYTAFAIDGDSSIYDPDGPAGPQGSKPAAPTGYILYSFTRNTGTWSDGTNRVCDRNVTATRVTYETRYKFTNWNWAPSDASKLVFDTSRFKLGESVTLASATSSTPKGSVAVAGEYNIQALVAAADKPDLNGEVLQTQSYTWNKCIEERPTVAKSETEFDPLPAGALDLRFNELPDEDNEGWAPIWPKLVNESGANGNPSSQCPAAARKLNTMTASEVSAYVNTLTPTGSTYLDFGMIWGARLLSPNGIFASDNQTAPNRRQINRHLIFMTDGQMDPSSTLYTMYGLEGRNKRISGNAGLDEMSVLRPRHRARFLAVCKQLRDMEITVWTIAFATAQASEMVECATPGKALVATTTDDLKLKFKEIANRIAELRLAK